jgi:lipopolysaccharide transport system ATP-binding protein
MLMSNSKKIAVRIEGVSKVYRLGHINYRSIQQSFKSFMASRFGSRDPNAPIKNGRAIRFDRKANRFWALRDITFDIARGERVGILGPNGAGKSTLLKILARITSPTSGVIGINGRVTSLLEVGTGFHGELSGRENVFLNAAILGMSRAETRKRYDQIVEFSEIGEFIDTPVKRYSSGMHVRLAFAVAAHLDPDVLILDEILAVGDAAFQQKCIDRIHEMTRDGNKTIIFVSHNMDVVKKVCRSTIQLRDGMVESRQDLPIYQPLLETNA